MNDIEKKIETIVREELEWESDTVLNDEMSPDNTLDWDSLVSMALILQLEKTFSIKFEYEDVLKMNSLGDIKKLVLDKIQ